MGVNPYPDLGGKFKLSRHFAVNVTVFEFISFFDEFINRPIPQVYTPYGFLSDKDAYDSVGVFVSDYVIIGFIDLVRASVCEFYKPYFIDWAVCHCFYLL